MRVWMLCGALLLTSPVLAQEGGDTPPAGGPPAAVAEFDAIALKKVAPKEMAARNAAVGEWAARHAETDLGEFGFLRHLARYFDRDYVGAGDALLDWFGTRKQLPAARYHTIIGRILFARSVMAVRDGNWEIYDKALPYALRMYKPRVTIYRGAGGALSRRTDAPAAKRLVALLGNLMHDTAIPVEDRLEAGRAMLGVGAKQGGAKRTARPQPVFAPFTATDMDGVQRSTERYKGKVLLIDFWATWCGPCLREMPNVVAAYNKFHGRGFEVLGVTLDKEDQAAKVRDVAKQMQMPWPQIYDGKGWKAELAVKSQVRSIPATFLIGRDGTLRHTNLRGPALIAAIEQLVNEPAPEPKPAPGGDF